MFLYGVFTLYIYGYFKIMITVHVFLSMFLPYYLLPGSLLSIYRMYVQEHCDKFKGTLASIMFCEDLDGKPKPGVNSNPNLSQADYWKFENLVWISLVC